MISKVKTFIVLVAILAVVESAFFYIVITGTINYDDGYAGLTIGAYNDASYTNGSMKWLFFYLSKDAQLSNTTRNFNFPVFPDILETPELGTILSECLIGTEWVGRFLQATTGDSCSFYGLKIIVHESNLYSVVLWVKSIQ